MCVSMKYWTGILGERFTDDSAVDKELLVSTFNCKTVYFKCLFTHDFRTALWSRTSGTSPDNRYPIDCPASKRWRIADIVCLSVSTVWLFRLWRQTPSSHTAGQCATMASLLTKNYNHPLIRLDCWSIKYFQLCIKLTRFLHVRRRRLFCFFSVINLSK